MEKRQLDLNAIGAYVALEQQTLGIKANIGGRLPTHADAGAKALVAFSSRETSANFLKKGCVVHSQHDYRPYSM